ncbi:toxin-antitoxin system HicB family antitoxin [Crossiella sp. NPDC003009]
MDLTSYVTRLREDLTTAASAGDEQTRRTAAVLAAALEPAARLALMNALSDLAAEVTANLDGQVVDVRLDGRDVRVVVTPAAGRSSSRPADSVPPPPPPPPPPQPGLGEGGDISRITLRLFEELKGKAEKAANAQGVSLNSWLSQAVQGALQGQGTGERSRRHEWRQERQSEQREATNSRLRGWVQG